MGEDAVSLLTLSKNGKQFILAITISLPSVYFLSLKPNHLYLPPFYFDSAPTPTSTEKKKSHSKEMGQKEMGKD